MKSLVSPILAAALAACLSQAAAAEPQSVGAVDKVQEQAVARPASRAISPSTAPSTSAIRCAPARAPDWRRSWTMAPC